VSMHSGCEKVLYDAGSRLRELLRGKKPEKINVSDYPSGTEQQFAAIVNHFIEHYIEICDFIIPLSQGKLNECVPKSGNILSSPFKALHAQLLHLTWQTEQVAKGDYNQRVDFMGQFSTAFNSMVEQLAEREKGLKKARDELETKVTERTAELAKTNELLREDIAQRKLMEARLEREQRQLEDLVHIVTHDMKTPVHGIGILAQWFARDYEDKLDEQGKEWMKLLNTRARRIDNMLDTMLKYSQIERCEQREKEVDLNLVVAELIREIKTSGDIDILVENELPVVLCEEAHINDVFRILLGNAVAYMDKPKGRISVAFVEEDKFWKFSVADNGRGIEKEHFERIFKIFQRLSPSSESEIIGAGLTLAKKIVELHGGRIWVESSIGHGSTFSFTFPKQVIKYELVHAGQNQQN
jgi:signal transduction histidine kinase